MTHASLTDAPVAVRQPAQGRPPRRAFGGAARRILGTLGSAVFVMWGAATVAFAAQVGSPNDRATTILNLRSGQIQERTPEETGPINAEYGFDQPLLSQYLDYLAGLLRGDLGTSYQQHRPVWDMITEQLGATLALSLAAIALAWILMVVWVVATAGRRRWISDAGTTADTIAANLPQYWLGIILLLVFAVQLAWVPVVASGPVGLILPALTLAIPLAGFLGQSTRASFEHALAQPFVLTARVRGMSDLAVRLRHVLRHAALAPLTLTGWALGATLSGAVIVESVFTRPGIGRVLVTGIENQDLPVVTGIVVLIAALYVVVNVLIDASYSLIDPRIRHDRNS